MNVGLINIEPKIQNTAYMQIARHHKDNGDTVQWAKAEDYSKYDKLYCSSLFDFTDHSNVPDNALCGGTGYDLTTTLPTVLTVIWTTAFIPNVIAHMSG